MPFPEHLKSFLAQFMSRTVINSCQEKLYRTDAHTTWKTRFPEAESDETVYIRD